MGERAAEARGVADYTPDPGGPTLALAGPGPAESITSAAEQQTPERPAMKFLLWLVLAVGVLVNAFSSFAFDGTREVVVSVVTGAAVIGSITALVLTRERHP
ncbi:hypothetical protein GCM10018785_45660 [Streptomyces longispororuber]|uniref:Uncharacterized protein n=2 Tax=Streptomyces longispororuber TaxID=68230 RepID=A0A918ZWZ0_9ACTN|nr:hypothetical protein GCM10018785_45660 [Streptomyces longispororuber]